LAHIANQVFLELTTELEAQGVSRKVSADMFGMALRAYIKKIRRKAGTEQVARELQRPWAMSTHPFRLISEVMTRPVYAIAPGTHVAEVFSASERLHVHHFPIVSGGKVVGIICTCDLLEAQPDAEVSGWARRDVATLEPTATAQQAATLMRNQEVGSVVIVESSHLRGIVTREDLASDPSLALTLEEGHCSACGTRKHLRRGPNELFLCDDCSQRARADSWYDTGGGD
jgi:CBS domain-containing protein